MTCHRTKIQTLVYAKETRIRNTLSQPIYLHMCTHTPTIMNVDINRYRNRISATQQKKIRNNLNSNYIPTLQK